MCKFTSTQNPLLQTEAAGKWKGSCDRLSNIIDPTLVITGPKYHNLQLAAQYVQKNF